MCADGRDFRLYPDCKIVHGAVRSAIYDLRRNAMHLIPKDVAAAFTGDVCHLGLLPEKRREEVLSFFREAELGCIGMPASFRPVSEDFICAGTITNAIIDFGTARQPIEKIAAELDGLLCDAVYLRFMESFDLQRILDIAGLFSDISVSSIDIGLPFSNSVAASIAPVSKEIPLCDRIIVHGAPATETDNSGRVTVRYVRDMARYSEEGPVCEASDFSAFADANLRLYNESLAFHNCLNRKVYIDSGGNVGNCPAMEVRHGNVNDRSLREIVGTAKFQEVWKEGRRGKCRDCELRYACIQCPSKERRCTYKVYDEV